MKTPSPTSETEIILLAIAKEKLSFARLAAAAQACDNPKAKRLYNQLALDELKHVLTLVSLMDGLADDWLTRLDLTLPLAAPPDRLPQSEEAILRSSMEEEELSKNFFGHLAQEVDSEELLDLLQTLRAEEEDHRTRLRSLLYGLEADRPVVAKWLRSIRRMIPAAQWH